MTKDDLEKINKKLSDENAELRLQIEKIKMESEGKEIKFKYKLDLISKMCHE